MSTLGRRLFARAAVGAPVALKIGATGRTPVAGVVDGYGGYPQPTPPGMSGGGNSVANAIWTALSKQRRTEVELQTATEARRLLMGGLDPDLAVLNSMALQHRVIRQVDRAVAERDRSKSLRARIITMLGGKPEEYGE